MNIPKEEWIVGSMKLDRKSQLALYNYCFPELNKAARKFFSTDEERMHVINGSFIKIIENLHKYEPINFNAWIKRICTNESIDYLRKNKKYKETFLIKTSEGKNEPCEAPSIETSIENEHLESLLLQLNTPCRIVFNLFAIEGFSHKEISQSLGITVETSKWHTKMARKKLKDILVNPQKKTIHHG
ncbi:MAG: sigma-70 family RNA polymerase sigma factor [Flavobacteriia bacterium]|nr:sigma-70 family RNA polymerase sigma factor [Flavobacteriia bacterium]